MASTILLRRGVVASLPTLATGEPGYATDTKTLYVGDGTASPPRVLMAGTGIITNADVNASAAIAYSKLNLATSIVNADISASAAIARSKIAAGTASHVVIHDGSGNLSSEAALAIARGGTNNGSLAVTAGGVLYTDGTKVVNVGAGSSGQALLSGGAGAPTWGSALGTLYRKTADETRNNNTFSDDTHFTGISLAAGKNYILFGVFTIYADSTNPDIKLQFLDAGGATLDYFYMGLTLNQSTSNSFGTSLAAVSTSTGLIPLIATTNVPMMVMGHIGVTSGTASIKLQWAQNTTDAVNLTRMRKGSWLRVQEAV